MNQMEQAHAIAALMNILAEDENVRRRGLDEVRGRLERSLGYNRVNLSNSDVAPETLGHVCLCIEEAGWTVDRISLASNGLMYLPNEICRLRGVTHMDVNRNRLVSLPDSIGLLNDLVSLNADMNLLTRLPVSIGSLTRMKFLLLSHNAIVELPHTIGCLRNLKVVHLQCNQLADVAHSTFNSDGLKELWIQPQGDRRSLERSQAAQLAYSYGHVSGSWEGFAS